MRLLTAVASLSVAWASLCNAIAMSVVPRSNAFNFAKRGLSQQATNGGGNLGLINSPTYGQFIDTPMPGSSDVPWGPKNTQNTNPYKADAAPYTGETRYFSLTVTNTTLAPDGVEVPVLVANGQFPGPLIEANWGDWIEVSVTNGLVIEGTAIHWHGFLMTGTPWYDGVPGVSQCPIAPGKTFVYRFRAELYGTSWWHSHYSGQYANGLSGPIVIHGPNTGVYDIDLGPVMLSDWSHRYYVNIVEQFYKASLAGPILIPTSNNVLIQGKANYQCKNTQLSCTPNAGLASFKFQSGKKHLLRLINHSAEAIIFFSIDGYSVTVIANDFVAVEPYQTDLVTIAAGQRTDVVVEGTGSSTDSVWMRITEGPSALSPVGKIGCSLNDGLSYTTTAGIFYENADANLAPTTTSVIDPSRYLFPNACSNQDLTVATPSFVQPVTEPATTLSFLMTVGQNATGDNVWFMNDITAYVDYNDPVLMEAKLGNEAFPTERQVYDMGTNTSVRIILTSLGVGASHPMHIHGHSMQVLAEGLGSWDGTTIVNPSNPQRRDTQLIRPNGYLVVQVELDNPGVWAFHCHIAWHLSAGMSILLNEQTPSLENDLQMPYSVAQTCRDWSAWTGDHVVDQIDSGL